MKPNFLILKSAWAALIAALAICACGNDNNKTPAQTATETALPVRTEKSNQRPTVFNT